MMISHITKLLLVLQIVATVSLFFLLRTHFHVSTAFSLMASMFAVLFFRALITANNFLIAWLYSSETPAAYRIGLIQTIKLFFNEFKATMLTSSLNLPFLSVKRFTTQSTSTIPVLLVHGYACNSGEWHPINVRLMREGITHSAVNLEPVFGSIDTYVPIISHAVKQLRKETGHDKIIILAHSMGGLATRAYIRDHGSAHIAKIITLGTPHRGTVLAKFGKGQNSAQMRWIGSAKEGHPSDWLVRLADQESAATYGLFVSIYSHHDNIIAPQTSCTLIGARNIAWCGIGHVALLFDAAIQDQVVEEIRQTKNG